MRFLLALFVALFLAPARLFPADAPAATAAATPATAAPRFASEIAAFEKSDAEHPPEKGAVLFIGSSSIRLWKSLAQDFPNQHVLNRGFGGSEISDSIGYIDRIVVPYAPRLIVMYAGGNDIHSGKSAERVIDDFKTFVEKVRGKLPNVPIDYISI
ncbi:MAG TPA: GDSL-type esterase/lipase family protein, partial [Chthoniobacteraceae bacterium]